MTTTIEHIQSALNGLGLKAIEARLENLLEQAAKTGTQLCGFPSRRDRLRGRRPPRPVFASASATGTSTFRQKLRSVRLQLSTFDR